MTTDSLPSAAPPGLLHMGGKPRTQVVLRINTIEARVGAFSLDDMGSELSRIGQGRTRARRRETLASFVCRGDVASLTERLDRAWALLALRGAILLYAGLPGRRSDAATPCRDPLLVLNVLARARDDLLLPDAPLVLQRRALDRRVFADDPRLTSQVREERDGSD